ncbi:MAG: maleylpyruvate isomerase family mycothiol-dependent enzyme [Acidobacteria bacterium]|nr:maleylpyruvate isomerase family mycothiol-dependent enzyme [Acidobacteriota bacterium]
MHSPAAQAYAWASEFFVDVVAQIGVTQYDDAGLGDWSVRELIAHANRAHVLVVEYIEHPVDPAQVPADYFSPASIGARARQAVVDLGDDVVAGVQEAARRARQVIGDAPPRAKVGTPAGSMLLDQYLPGRTTELLIHGLDLARATGSGATPPPEAMKSCLRFLADRAAQIDQALPVVLALSGRGHLSHDFSVF